jgi:hypothetical protein
MHLRLRFYCVQKYLRFGQLKSKEADSSVKVLISRRRRCMRPTANLNELFAHAVDLSVCHESIIYRVLVNVPRA